jgi:diguanylate cyclase (GGDEF)-like protein
VNDSFGHQAGDRLLLALTEAAAAVLRDGDVIGRLGGDEFAVALAETRLDQAVASAERIRRAVAELRIDEDGGTVGSSVSIGVASLHAVASFDELFAVADAALYRAKALGGDCVAAAPDGAALRAVVPRSVREERPAGVERARIPRASGDRLR